jgi:hypothetical protein
MNCDEYVTRWLSAEADGELSEPERELAEEHRRGCPQCRARLSEELALKTAIRHQMGTAKAPADVRLRIRAALGETAERGTGRRSTERRLDRERAARQLTATRRREAASRSSAHGVADRSASARKWLAIQFKRAQYLAPAGFLVIVLAASTVIVRVAFHSAAQQTAPNYQKSIPAFDFAIDRFSQLSRDFDPNVPAEAFSRDNGAYFAWVEGNDPLRHVSAELPDISESYEKAQMPPEFCDFALAGYELVGGRIDRRSDGEPVTYTLYRNPSNSILSIGLKQRMSAPLDGYWLNTHALYSYRGYSICLTINPSGYYTSIIVTRAPMLELLRDIAISDVAFWDR